MTLTLNLHEEVHLRLLEDEFWRPLFFTRDARGVLCFNQERGAVGSNDHCFRGYDLLREAIHGSAEAPTTTSQGI